MCPATLRTISIKQTCDYLEGGVWERCLESPFSTLPTSIVQELFLSMLRRDKIARSRPLTTSGRLVSVDLFRVTNFNNYSLLFLLLSLNCQNLKTLLLPAHNPRCTGSLDRCDHLALQELLLKCTNLEELHSNVPFHPSSLRHCRKLKRLRVHFGSKEALNILYYFTADLQRLRSFEVFTFCVQNRPAAWEDKVRFISSIATILDNVPQLTSLGCLDSSMATNDLHDRYWGSLGGPRHFNLRRCFWASIEGTARFEHCEMIRIAALTFPLVEALVIQVDDGRCLEHLRSMQNLTSLSIDFYYTENEYKSELYLLLKEIGHQLLHLCIVGARNVKVRLHLEIICKYCPNLRSLRLNCCVTSKEDAEPSVNFLHLKRFSVTMYDRSCLLFILSHCLRLRVLCLLWHSETLDDDLLQSVLHSNPFAELEVALIQQAFLSESGLRKFLQSAPKLRKFYFTRFTSLFIDAVIDCMREVNPRVDCQFSGNILELEKEEFPDFLFGCFL